jgi:glycosyltransferase involved in cell wall biosynthesis
MIENFVQKILRLKNDKELYERLKSNALSEVNRKFDLADSVDRYIHVFEDVSDARKAIPQ